jgi:hypothetical protein
MPGVPRELVEHALNIDPKTKPIKQPLRRFDEPKRKAIASELHRLENAGFICHDPGFYQFMGKKFSLLYCL